MTYDEQRSSICPRDGHSGNPWSCQHGYGASAVTGLVIVTVTKRLPLAENFQEIERRAKSVLHNLQAEGFTVDSYHVEEFREADEMDGEVRA